MALLSKTDADSMLVVHDRFFVPCVLQPFAAEMARRLTRRSGGPVLETCAGTGTLTQAIASSISAGLAIVATDPSATMIEYARAKPGLTRVNWQEADPSALPFADKTFGLIVSHFGVAALPDATRAFKESHRVMKRSGHFEFSTLGSLRHNPVAACLQRALEDLFPSGPPRFVQHDLHGFISNEAIDDDLTQAGFTDAVYTVVELPFVASSARDIATGYCLGTRLRLEIEARVPGNSDAVTEAIARALEQRFGKGPIDTTMRAHFISAAG